MNEYVGAALLGLVQGLTEFLPVSSSGHLVLFQRWLPHAGDPVAFDLVLHLGTLLPVLGTFRADLAMMLRDLRAGEGPPLQRPGVRLGAWVVLGSVPTAAIGLSFKDLFEQAFSSLGAVAVAFAITATLLLATRFAKAPRLDLAQMGPQHALIIGVVQGLAITPGISRSGSTIGAALLLGIDRGLAARFSFLLALPAVGGAFLLQARELRLDSLHVGPLALGFVASALSGWAALRLLLRLVRAGDFSRFAFYLYPLALVAGYLAWTDAAG